MGKRNRGWLLTGFIFIAIPLAILFYLEAIDVDCDSFACVGYIILLLPMFLLGIAILLLVLLVNIGREIREKTKKKKDEATG